MGYTLESLRQFELESERISPLFIDFAIFARECMKFSVGLGLYLINQIDPQDLELHWMSIVYAELKKDPPNPYHLLQQAVDRITPSRYKRISRYLRPEFRAECVLGWKRIVSKMEHENAIKKNEKITCMIKQLEKLIFQLMIFVAFLFAVLIFLKKISLS